jgi:hypothetical protein
MRALPTNDNSAELDGSEFLPLDEIRERMTALIVDLDGYAEAIAAAHLQAALDCLDIR